MKLELDFRVQPSVPERDPKSHPLGHYLTCGAKLSDQSICFIILQSLDPRKEEGEASQQGQVHQQDVPQVPFKVVHIELI